MSVDLPLGYNQAELETLAKSNPDSLLGLKQCINIQKGEINSLSSKATLLQVIMLPFYTLIDCYVIQVTFLSDLLQCPHAVRGLPSSG